MTRKNFKVCRLLGKGSFGSVFKVIRISDQQEYAMKEVSLRNLKDKEQQEAVNEIRILASLTHKNIIRYCEAFLENNTLCIVTEYAKKGDVGKKIKRYQSKGARIKEEVIWSYLIQICHALGMLHGHKILHRDIKPKNIFLTAADQVKLGDLGCSKLVKVGLARTQIGTPFYMSPEIWLNKRYSDKSDMWSLGCVLYEMCTFHPPFVANDIRSLSKKVRNSPTPTMPSYYSKNLTSIIKRLLSECRFVPSFSFFSS